MAAPPFIALQDLYHGALGEAGDVPHPSAR